MIFLSRTRGTGLLTDAERIHSSRPMSNLRRKVFAPGAPGGRGIFVEDKDQKAFRAPSGAAYSALKRIVKVGAWVIGHLHGQADTGLPSLRLSAIKHINNITVRTAVTDNSSSERSLACTALSMSGDAPSPTEASAARCDVALL